MKLINKRVFNTSSRYFNNYFPDGFKVLSFFDKDVRAVIFYYKCAINFDLRKSI